ncbi:zinc finger protein [Trichonephila clavipes]|nr:zinc finger protein [Trichonephila clavipes]
MDKTTGQYPCKYCQLYFKDFNKYLYHKYKKHDGQDVKTEIKKDDDASLPKDLENSELTDSFSDNFNQPLDLSVSKETQFHHDVIHEGTTTPLWSRNVTGYSQEVCSRYHSNPDVSRNDSFLPLKYSQNEMVSFGMDLQLGTNQPSISFEYNPLEIHSRRISGIFHPNQSPISEQMLLLRQSNNEYLHATESSTSSGIRHISQRSPQVSTNPSSVSLVYIPIQSSTFEMTQNFNTNQRILSSEREKCVNNTLETNPQSRIDHRVATEVRDIDSLVESALSLEDRGVHEMNINFEKYSENIRNNLDSVGRSIRHRESKHPRKECFDEKNVSVFSINQNENVAQNKTSASNSPLEKISDALSEEISRQGERSGNVLHNKRDEIRYQYNTKNTCVFESGEMNLEENLNQTRDPRADIKIKPRTCEKCEKLFNEESIPVEISANQNRKKKSILNLIETRALTQRGQNDQNVVHTRKRPDELDQLKIDLKQASTSSGIRHIKERFPQINTDAKAVSLGNSGVESSIERNQHWNTNQLSMSSENKPEFNRQRIDPQSCANQRAVTDNNDNSLLKRLVSSPRVSINKMNQNLKKYSKENCIKLDSVGRSTKTFADRKHTNTEYIDSCGACIPTIPQNKIEAQNIISASNSSLKHHFHFHSKETSKKHESCRWSLNNKNNQVQAHNKDKYATGCGSIEKKLGEVSNSSNQQGSGKKKFTSDCENFKCSSNQQSNLIKNDVDCNGKKKHVCDICLKVFTRKDNLTIHKLIHTGLKPFKCDICSKVFSQKSNLKHHKAVHTELRPFKCDKCKKDFKRRRNLTEHIPVHTRETTFKCDKCGKKFKSKNGLKNHKCAYTRN